MKHALLYIYILLLATLPSKAQNTGKANYNYLRGLELFEQGQLNEAWRYFAEALQEDDKDNGYATAYLGRISHEMGYIGKALQAFHYSLKNISPKDKVFLSQIHCWRADSYWSLNDTLHACDEARQAMKLTPKSAMPLLTHGILNYHKKNYSAARNDLNTVWQLDTTDLTPRYYLLQIALEEKKWEEAATMARSIISRDSTQASAHASLAQALLRLSRTEEAAEALGESYHFRGTEYNIVGNWADSLAQTDYAATMRGLEKSLKKHVGDADIHYAMASAAMATRHYATSLDHCRTFAQLKGNDTYEVTTAYGLLYIYRPDSAWICAQHAFRADSTQAGTAITCGRVLQEMGRYEESLKYFTKVINEEPLNAEAYHERAYSYRMLGNTAAALDDALHEAALEPDNASAQLCAARLLLAKGETTEAQRFLHEAVRIDSVPQGSTVRMFALQLLGQDEEAKAWCLRMLHAEELTMERGQMAQPDEIAYFNAARLHAMLGERAETLRLLRLAMQYGFRSFTDLHDREELAALQGEPEFEALIKEYEGKPAIWK